MSQVKIHKLHSIEPTQQRLKLKFTNYSQANQHNIILS